MSGEAFDEIGLRGFATEGLYRLMEGPAASRICLVCGAPPVCGMAVIILESDCLGDEWNRLVRAMLPMTGNPMISVLLCREHGPEADGNEAKGKQVVRAAIERTIYGLDAHLKGGSSN